MPDLITETTVLDDQLVVEEALFKKEDRGTETFSRLRVKRPDAACVLLLNTDSNNVILTRQFRYPLTEEASEGILEIVAGKLDEGESPEEAAIRETEEETGYRIAPDDLRLLISCFSTPGYSTEQFHIYVANVTDELRVGSGGGLAAENERIELIEMGLADFLEQVRTGGIRDAKTCLAGMYLEASAGTGEQSEGTGELGI